MVHYQNYKNVAAAPLDSYSEVVMRFAASMHLWGRVVKTNQIFNYNPPPHLRVAIRGKDVGPSSFSLLTAMTVTE